MTGDHHAQLAGRATLLVRVADGILGTHSMTFGSLDDGGAQERALAAQHREWADRVSDRWPRTGALLREIADHFEKWARRNDDQSERFGDDGS